MTGTVRQAMIKLLKSSPQDLRSLSQLIGITEKEAAMHLDHIQKTARRQRYTLDTTPFRCRLCGFEFKDRTRFTKPGRCPSCQKGAIDPAVYRIMGESSETDRRHDQ